MVTLGRFPKRRGREGRRSNIIHLLAIWQGKYRYFRKVPISREEYDPPYIFLFYAFEEGFPFGGIVDKVFKAEGGIEDLTATDYKFKSSPAGFERIYEPFQLSGAQEGAFACGALIGRPRRLSRKQKGSKNSEKARLILAKCHEYVANARKDFLHKLSKAVIDENQVVVAEGLSVKGLMKSFLSKHVADSGWGMFLRFLEYKARWYGRQLVVVDRYCPSSKTCSECGYIYGDMDLSVREWICPVCGAYHDRDVNASKNLYNYGFAHLTSGRVGTPRTYACGECGLHSMKQEATTSISGG